MVYGIRELSELAGVSARTLRYYDEIGLLKPLYVEESGYRFYGEQEAELLQQILFYRERGFDLKHIHRILYEKDFDTMQALEEHLRDLEERRSHIDALIWTVKQTILARKGECEMSVQEKFEALKERAVKENEEQYGAEIREKYGESQIEESNRKILHMSKDAWEEFQNLEAEIRKALENGVLAGIKAESEAAKSLVLLHKKWLCMILPEYSAEVHKGLAVMYTADERFTKYYDQEVPGCAELLNQAVQYWAGRLNQ